MAGRVGVEEELTRRLPEFIDLRFDSESLHRVADGVDVHCALVGEGVEHVGSGDGRLGGNNTWQTLKWHQSVLRSLHILHSLLMVQFRHKTRA